MSFIDFSVQVFKRTKWKNFVTDKNTNVDSDSGTMLQNGLK